MRRATLTALACGRVRPCPARHSAEFTVEDFYVRSAQDLVDICSVRATTSTTRRPVQFCARLHLGRLAVSTRPRRTGPMATPGVPARSAADARSGRRDVRRVVRDASRSHGGTRCRGAVPFPQREVSVPRSGTREEGRLEVKRGVIAILVAGALATSGCANMSQTEQRTLTGGAGGAAAGAVDRRDRRQRRPRRADRRRRRRGRRLPLRQEQGSRTERLQPGRARRDARSAGPIAPRAPRARITARAGCRPCASPRRWPSRLRRSAGARRSGSSCRCARTR